MTRLPPCAAWRHVHAREGFEVVFFDRHDTGLRVEGHTTAVEAGEAFAVRYEIELDRRWHTLSARIQGSSARGRRSVVLEADGRGGWLIDGDAAPHLDGCPDVDLESSSFTNALPVGRLALAPGEGSDAPAAFVRARDLAVDRLEQRYVRIDDWEDHPRYDYTSPAFGFRCELVYDEHGLVLDYPGIASRVRQ